MGIFSWTTEAGETGGPAALGYCFMASSSNVALSALSAESLPGLGTNIPSTMAQTRCECHQNRGQTSSHEGAVLTGSWHLLSAPAKIKSGATATVDLQHSLKGVEGGDQERGLCALGKLAEQAFR